MIGQLTGKILHKSPTDAVIDIGGVGYQVNIPVTTFDRLPEVGETVTVFTYLHVREDALQLYGFSTKKEKELFRKLITVSGIGPKLAQTVMSGLSYEDLIRAIQGGDIAQLNKIAGVGRKTAERLIVELRDKLEEVKLAEERTDMRLLENIHTEALLALTTLGYSRSASENALRSVLAERNGSDVSIEELIKAVLRKLSK
jgi:holliday junction DNA helicase RuvA